jgi:hypothetical protein
MPAASQLGVQLVDDRPEPGEQEHRQLEAVSARGYGPLVI